MNVFTRDNTNDGDGWDVPPRLRRPHRQLRLPVASSRTSTTSSSSRWPTYGGGSPCGSLFLDEPGFPGGWAMRSTPSSGAAARSIRHPLTPKGAGFKAEARRSSWTCRAATDMDVDGSGRFYVSSWANGGFNYSRAQRRLRRPPRAEGHSGPRFPDLKKADGRHSSADSPRPARVTRHGGPAGDPAPRRQRRVRAPGCERLMPRRTSRCAGAAWPRCSRSSSSSGAGGCDVRRGWRETPKMRESALRALATTEMATRSVPTGPFVEALTDPNPRVRLVAAWGIGRLGKTDAAPAHRAARRRRRLRSSPTSRSTASWRSRPRPCLKAVDSSDAEARPRRVGVLQQLHDPAVVDGLIDKLANGPGPARRGRRSTRASCRLYLPRSRLGRRLVGHAPGHVPAPTSRPPSGTARQGAGDR